MLTDKGNRLSDMMEVWLTDIEFSMNENHENGDITRTTILRLKRIVKEINEEVGAYEK